MKEIFVDEILKYNKSFIDSYIFSLYLSKINKTKYHYGFLFKKEEQLFFVTTDNEIFYKLNIKGVENILFENSIKIRKNSKTKKTTSMTYDYAEQVCKIINGTKNGNDFFDIFSLLNVYGENDLILVSITENNQIHINQVKNANKNGDFSLPNFCFELKNISVQHNIYDLTKWDIFNKFENKNILKYDFKIPEYDLEHVCYIKKDLYGKY